MDTQARFFINSEVYGVMASAETSEEGEWKALVTAVNTGRTVYLVDTES